MRRFISYLLLCGATLIGVGAAVAPTALRADTDLAYSDGKTLYFKAAEWDDTTTNGNYTGGDGAPLAYDSTKSKQPVEYIAQTMRDRLDAYGISGYKVVTQGADIIAVTLRTAGDSEQLYSDLEHYLAFSGGDYYLEPSMTTGADYSYNERWGDIIDGQTAFIADMDQGSYKVPTVVVPLKSGDDYKTAFLDLVKYCKDNTTEADEEAGTSGSNCMIVVWANHTEADSYDLVGSDANVASKIVTSVAAANATYYADGDDDEETPYLRLIPSSAALGSEGYDPSKTVEAYNAARVLMLEINAGSFEYDELRSSAGTTPKYAVTYLYEQTAPASVEALTVNGDWTRSVAFSATLICILVCVVFLIVLLIIFERILSILQLASTAIGTFAAYAVFVAFGAPFNIAALIALAAGSLSILFGSLFYAAKLKEEIYKGRTLKKAHAEATRKALLPTLDMAIVAILIGICLYGLGGDVASKGGVMLVLCGFFGFFANFLYTRIAGWLLCNDSMTAVKFPKLLGIHEDRIPDLIKEEKPSYFGPYADRDFSKGKKISIIASCLFLLAGIGASIGFGIASGGTSFFNSSSYESSAPVLRIDVRSNSSDIISIESFSDKSKLLDKTFDENNGVPSDIFHQYKVNDAYLASYVSDISLNKSPKYVYVGEGDNGTTYYWFYYEITLGNNGSVFASAIKDDAAKLTISRYESGSYVAIADNSLAGLATDIIDQSTGGAITEIGDGTGAYSDVLVVTFDGVIPADLTPYLWQVTLGLGVGIACVLVYFVLRFRPSRGIFAGLFVAGSSFISVSFFILTRIASTPAVSLGALIVAVIASGLAIYVLAAEKEIYRESKEREKNNAAFRNECLKQATSRQAGNVLFFALLAFYVSVVFLAFGPRIYANAYITAILGVAFALALVLTALAPLSSVLGNAFGRIQFNRPKSKKKAKAGGQLLKKKKNAEPEESIFIGIND